MDLHEADRRISGISGSMDFYSFLTPINAEEERNKFFARLESGRVYDPIFEYKEKALGDKKGEIGKIRDSLKADGGMAGLLIGKADLILARIDLLEADDADFGKAAVKLHGMPDKETISTALDVLEGSRSEAYAFPEETVTPGEMASVLKSVLEEKGIRWSVEISGKIIPKITVSGADRTIYINARIHYTEEEVQRLKVHEIEVHIYRGENGRSQPYNIFAEGLAGYDETEEGLAILAEEKTGCLDIDTRQMKLYAGRALAAERCLKGSFYEAFESLREFFPDEMAYRLTERSKRGMRDTSAPGGLTKGYHYISGWRQVGNYINAGGDPGILYVGKIGLKDVDVVRGLLDRGELRAPEHVPDFVK